MIPNVRCLWRSVGKGKTDFVETAIRRVLHLKAVTQCAMLEDFGIFLVLADKVWL